MTTTSPALRRSAPAAATGRLSSARVVRAEVLALATLRSMRWLAVVVVLGVLGTLLFAGGPTPAATSTVLGASTLAGIGVALLAGVSTASGCATERSARPHRGAGSLVGVVPHVEPSVWLTADTVLHVVGGVCTVVVTGLVGLFTGVVLRGVAITTTAVIVVLFLLAPLLGAVRVGDGWRTDFLVTEAGAALALGTATSPLPVLVVALSVLVPAGVAALRFSHGDA